MTEEAYVNKQIYYIRESAQNFVDSGGDRALFFAGQMSMYIESLSRCNILEASEYLNILVEINQLYRQEMNKRIKP